MGRPRKKGLDYFPLDVGFFDDKRIRRFRQEFNSNGPDFYLYTLSRIYGGEGYYVPYDEDFKADAALDIGCTIEKIGLMVTYLSNRSLLTCKPLGKITVLTSHGIQRQYVETCKQLRRTVEIDPRICLLKEGEAEGSGEVQADESFFGENPGFYGENGSFYGENPLKEKERKEKETKLNRKKEKEKESKRARVREGPSFSLSDEMESVLLDWSEHMEYMGFTMTDGAERALRKRVADYCGRYGEQAVAEVIQFSIDSKYKNPVLDRLDRPGRWPGGMQDE